MRSATRVFSALSVLVACGAASADSLRETVLRNAAVEAGFVPAEKTHVPASEALAQAGKLLFETKEMSLDRETACASCHLDRFGSADGLPNAVGTLGAGKGMDRLMSGGDIIPRNTLPFWGRGGVGFDVFFWDGKVDASSGAVVSQFAGEEPSDDPLAIAVHLPPVEVGEMVTDSAANDALEGEDVASANQVYQVLVERIRKEERIGPLLANAKGKQLDELTFPDIADAVAAFIRLNFKVQDTRFHRFVFAGGDLTSEELAGGLLFYGKARCSACHNGPYFSDLDFHSIPFPQAGFGKNGFGVDYGRYNVTMDVADRYRFRTPPLFNVTKTAPYSHSGSVMDLGDAIRSHVDPLAIFQSTDSTGIQRAEFYEQLKSWTTEPAYGVYLDGGEIQSLKAFLATLEYDSSASVSEVD